MSEARRGEFGDELVSVKVTVNGRACSLTVEPRTTLLDALREQLALTGTKKACDRGECGACTVHVEGRRILSCMTLAAMQDGNPRPTRRRTGSFIGIIPAISCRPMPTSPSSFGLGADPRSCAGSTVRLVTRHNTYKSSPGGCRSKSKRAISESASGNVRTRVHAREDRPLCRKKLKPSTHCQMSRPGTPNAISRTLFEREIVRAVSADNPNSAQNAM